MAPEQAMGKPSMRSDVFSLGLVIYRMLTGHLPEWPFDWPPEGYRRLRQRVHPEMVAVLRKALEISPRKRHRDATILLREFRATKRKTLLRAIQRRN